AMLTDKGPSTEAEAANGAKSPFKSAWSRGVQPDPSVYSIPASSFAPRPPWGPPSEKLDAAPEALTSTPRTGTNPVHSVITPAESGSSPILGSSSEHVAPFTGPVSETLPELAEAWTVAPKRLKKWSSPRKTLNANSP